MKKSAKLFTAILFLLFTVICSRGQLLPSKAMLAMPGYEIEWLKAKQEGSYYSYPVMLEGQILDNTDFRMKGRAMLSVIMPCADCIKATTVSFYIYLKRNGKIVQDDKMTFLGRLLPFIEIEEVLLFSKPGDQLIIVPATKPEVKTKIILNEGC
jgi:hypothetical protein